MNLDRRELLASGGALSVALFAGCIGGGGGGTGAATTETTTAATETTATTTEATTETTTTTAETTTEATTTEATTTAQGPTAAVDMTATTFDPLRLSVDPGTTVTWTNRDPYAHDVTSAQFHSKAATWSLSSGNMAQGETVSATFEEAGVYEYYCTIHGESSMCGAVLVGDATLDQKLPCESGGGSGSDGGGYGDGY